MGEIRKTIETTSSDPLTRATFPCEGKAFGWISVRDRLPDSKGQYLVAATQAGHYRHVTVVSFTDHFVMNGHRAYWRVTHWMALPELPKEG